MNDGNGMQVMTPRKKSPWQFMAEEKDTPSGGGALAYLRVRRRRRPRFAITRDR
jgi:hypothetical protein